MQECKVYKYSKIILSALLDRKFYNKVKNKNYKVKIKIKLIVHI